MNKKTLAYIFGICGLVLVLLPAVVFIISGEFNFRMIAAPILGVGFLSRYSSLMREYKQSEVTNNDNK